MSLDKHKFIVAPSCVDKWIKAFVVVPEFYLTLLCLSSQIVGLNA